MTSISVCCSDVHVFLSSDISSVSLVGTDSLLLAVGARSSVCSRMLDGLDRPRIHV